MHATWLEQAESCFVFIDHLFRAADGGVEHGEDMWRLGERIGLNSLQTLQVSETLVRAGLICYGESRGIVRLTSFGVAAVLEAHDDPTRTTRHFPALADFNTPVGMLIQDGSLTVEQIRQMQSQLSSCLSALDGQWMHRANLSDLVDELDLALWQAHEFPDCTLEDLQSVARLLASHDTPSDSAHSDS